MKVEVEVDVLSSLVLNSPYSLCGRKTTMTDEEVIDSTAIQTRRHDACTVK